MSLLANHWAAKGHAITMVTLTSTTSDAYRLDMRVRRIGLGIDLESRSTAEAIKHNAVKIRRLRAMLASLAPDVAVSFMDKTNVLTLLACAGLGIPVVVSERTHPAYHNVGTAWSLLRRVTYPFADALVLQSEALRVWARRLVPSERTFVIPNPVADEFSAGGTAARGPIVLGLGRLSVEKGFDLLIKAFHIAVRSHPEWSLVIVGQGPKEGELKHLAAELLPGGAVVFPGPVNDPRRYYREARVFVLASRFEGFPNALLEAMACGCAVIAANCPGGTSEIVRHGVDGVLIPSEDIGALTSAMDRLMTDGAERTRLAVQALEVARRFGLGRIGGLWDDVFSKVRR